MAKQISTEELATAFEGAVRDTQKESVRDTQKGAARDVQKAKKSGKNKAVSLGVLIIGLIMLVVGAVFLILELKKASLLADGDFLVSAGEWRLVEGADCDAESECDDAVIWTFSEIGKGTLTTNGHKNDYDFIWAIRDGKLLIETDWLYKLNNEYEYALDQETRTLTVKSEGAEYKFVAEGQG